MCIFLRKEPVAFIRVSKTGERWVWSKATPFSLGFPWLSPQPTPAILPRAWPIIHPITKMQTRSYSPLPKTHGDHFLSHLGADPKFFMGPTRPNVI